MTDNQLERESKYRAAVALAKELLRKDYINNEEFGRMKEIFIRQFNPPVGSLEASI